MKPLVMSGPDVRHLISNTTGLEIPVITAKGLVFSAWVPSPEDRRAFANGEPLWLVQRGEAIPEMHMIVGKRDAVVPAEIRHEAAAMRTPEVQRAAEIEILTRRHAPKVRIVLLVLSCSAALLAGYGAVVLLRRNAVLNRIEGLKPDVIDRAVLPERSSVMPYSPYPIR